MTTKNKTTAQQRNQALKRQLAQFDDELLKLLSIQYLFLSATQAMSAEGWPEDGDKLAFGLTLSANGLIAQGDALMHRLDAMMAIVAEA